MRNAFLVFVFLSLGSYPLSASPDQVDLKRQIAEQEYRRMEQWSKTTFEQEQEADKRYIQKGRKPTEEQKNELKIGKVTAIYEMVIYYMSCVEDNFQAENLELTYQKSKMCARQREGYFQEKIVFLSQFPESNSKILLCMEKTELKELEKRYPPYDWMVALIHKQPKANDAKAFLECVRTP